MRFLLLVVVVVSGCGGQAGYPCQTENESTCSSSTSVSFCERTELGGLKWSEYSCPGGCDALAKQKCSWKGVVAGEKCRTFSSYCDADGHIMTCSNSTGAPSSVWVGGDCPLCKKDRSLSETGNCSGDLCFCK